MAVGTVDRTNRRNLVLKMLEVNIWGCLTYKFLLHNLDAIVRHAMNALTEAHISTRYIKVESEGIDALSVWNKKISVTNGMC